MSNENFKNNGSFENPEVQEKDVRIQSSPSSDDVISEQGKKPLFSRAPSIATDKLIKLLTGKGTVGHILTDEDMTTACGKSTLPNHPGYASLQTAIRFCMENHHIVWHRLPRQNCIKCLDSGEISGVVNNDIKKIHRAAKRTVRRAAIVKLDELTDEAKGKFLVSLATSGTIMLETKGSTQKKFLTRNTSKPLDLPKLLAAYKQNL